VLGRDLSNLSNVRCRTQDVRRGIEHDGRRDVALGVGHLTGTLPDRTGLAM